MREKTIFCTQRCCKKQSYLKFAVQLKKKKSDEGQTGEES